MIITDLSDDPANNHKKEKKSVRLHEEGKTLDINMLIKDKEVK